MQFEVKFHTMNDASRFRDAAGRLGFRPKAYDNVVWVIVKGRQQVVELRELADRYNGDVYDVDSINENPMKKKTKHGLTRNEMVMIGVGAAVVGGLVYAVYKTQQSTQAAAAQVSGATGQLGSQVTQAASPLQQLTQGNPVYNVSQAGAESLLGTNYAGAPPIGTQVPAGS